MKILKKHLLIFMVLTIIFVATACSTTTTTTSSTEDTNSVTAIVDCNQFAKISVDELKAILGEPYETDEWNFTSPNNKTYATTSYFYTNVNNDVYEFMVIDNKVVRFTFWSPTYNDINAEDTPYSNKNDIPKMFGINENIQSSLSGDTGVALRYDNPTETIDDFWVAIMDDESKTLSCVKITYANEYFQ